MGTWGTDPSLIWLPGSSQRLHPTPSGARPSEEIHLPAGLTASLVSGTPAELSRGNFRTPTATDLRLPPRISGDTAFDKDILGSVSEQIQKNFARNHWKVSVDRDLGEPAQGWLLLPSASGGWSGQPVTFVGLQILEDLFMGLQVLGPRRGGLIPLSPGSAHSMLPPSSATSASWGRAQRVRRSLEEG